MDKKALSKYLSPHKIFAYELDDIVWEIETILSLFKLWADESEPEASIILNLLNEKILKIREIIDNDTIG